MDFRLAGICPCIMGKTEYLMRQMNWNTGFYSTDNRYPKSFYALEWAWCKKEALFRKGYWLWIKSHFRKVSPIGTYILVCTFGYVHLGAYILEHTFVNIQIGPHRRKQRDNQLHHGRTIMFSSIWPWRLQESIWKISKNMNLVFRKKVTLKRGICLNGLGVK